MIEYRGYVIVTNIEELKKEGVIWENGNDMRVKNFGVFHLKNTNFPQCFKYFGWDTHSCGDYFPCDKTEMITTIENTIEKLKNLKNLVDNI